MSFAGIVQFRKNLDKLMESEAFKNADGGQRMQMGTRLLRSKFGLGIIGKTKKLTINKEKSK